MKNSSIRFILILLSLFPAATLCLMWAAMSMLSLLKGDLSAIPYGLPFVSALVIFIIFTKDTLKLYKNGN